MIEKRIFFRIPRNFHHLAKQSNEALPESLIARVEMNPVEQGGGATVLEISGAEGEPVAANWLDEYAGYERSMRELIQIQAGKEHSES